MEGCRAPGTVRKDTPREHGVGDAFFSLHIMSELELNSSEIPRIHSEVFRGRPPELFSEHVRYRWDGFYEVAIAVFLLMEGLETRFS